MQVALDPFPTGKRDYRKFRNFPFELYGERSIILPQGSILAECLRTEWRSYCFRFNRSNQLYMLNMNHGPLSHPISQPNESLSGICEPIDFSIS
jgi:hypothetical protein